MEGKTEELKMEEVTQYVWSAGMTCGGCSNAITKIVTRLVDIEKVQLDVDVEKKQVTVTGIERETADLITTKLLKWGKAANKTVEAKF